jgi:hypothetical protein
VEPPRKVRSSGMIGALAAAIYSFMFNIKLGIRHLDEE